MTRKIWPLLSFFLLLSGCGSVDWFPTVTSSTTTTPTTLAAPTITAAISPTSITSGGTSALTLTITNKTGNPAQPLLQFQEQLPTGVTATKAVSNCGGTVETTSSFIIFSGGSMASGATSCTITATLGATNTGTTAQNFVIKSADFAGFGTSGLVSGVADQTLTVTPVASTSPALSLSVVPAVMLDNGNSNLTFAINNPSGSPAQTGMGFTEAISTDFTASVETPTQCGGTLKVSGQTLTFTGGALTSGPASCTLKAVLSPAVGRVITSDTAASVKNIDFTGFLGNLTNQVTDKIFNVIPSAVASTGKEVTVLNLDPTSNSDALLSLDDFTFKAGTNNPSTSNVDATVTVVGLDIDGAQIASTKDAMKVTILPGILTAQILNSTTFGVPSADTPKVQLWRILSVTVP